MDGDRNSNGPSPGRRGRSANAFRILAIDDSRSDINLLRESFRSIDESIKLIPAFSGEQALQILRDREPPVPDLILLDINMPGMCGHDVLAHIKTDAELRAIPVIVFSTSEDANDIHRAYQRDASGYIVKPRDFDGYIGVASRLVKFWRRTRDSHVVKRA